LSEQGERLPRAWARPHVEEAIEIAGRLLDRESEIEAQRFVDQKSKELLSEARTVAGDAFRELFAAADLAGDEELARATEAAETEAAAASREGRGLRDVVDVDVLKTGDVDEIAAALREAERAGPNIAAEAWTRATPQLKRLAAAERRSLRLNGQAFALYSKATLRRRPGLLDGVAAEHEAAARQLRTLIMKIADVVGVDAGRRPMTIPLTATTPAKPTMTSGSFFDRFPMRRTR
jgi:hypothetical protein